MDGEVDGTDMSERTMKTQFERSERRVRALEAIVLSKTDELSRALQEAQQFADFLTNVSNAMPASLIVFDAAGEIVHANHNAEKLLDYAPDQLLGKPLSRCFAVGEAPSFIGKNIDYFDKEHASPLHVEAECISKSGESIPTLVSATPVGQVADSQDGKNRLTVCILNDLRQQHQRESDLRQTQKLETLGRLAAGIAHEINTPAQYVSDSLNFIRDALGDIEELIVGYRGSLAGPDDNDARSMRQLEMDLDVDYILENAPDAIARAISGLDRISGICRSIKEFSHPSGVLKGQEDINHRILETLEIARNEYKYVAQVKTELSDIPLVECYGDEISQVILNIVVNAAHAVGERHGNAAKKGLIRIKSDLVDGEVRIAISDNGNGIPKALEARIFDAFFTTKQAGRGSGQGLALARSTVVARHGGRIDVNSEVGQGTTFEIFLPLELAELEVIL